MLLGELAWHLLLCELQDKADAPTPGSKASGS